MGTKDQAAAEHLDALRGGAPKRSSNVRELARFAANSTCNLANVGFAARVDFDKLLERTRFEAPFGQSPFAFRRGNRFEDMLRQDGHAPLLKLLGDTFGYDVSAAKVANLRRDYPRSTAGFAARATKTSELVQDLVRDAKDAPNLIDGAVLGRTIGGVQAYFEADAVAAHFGQPIHVGEIKSFPTVDGQADPEKIGAAVAQVSIYILLLRELVARLGGEPEKVSTNALLITAKNTGLQPTLHVKPVGREVDRAARILDHAPKVEDVAAALSAKTPSFAAVATGEEAARIDRLAEIADAVGVDYRPSCLSSCGLSRFCRERAHHAGDPCRVGGQLVRLLPGVASIDRVTHLVAGHEPSPGEAPVAEQLRRAAALRAQLAPPPPNATLRRSA